MVPEGAFILAVVGLSGDYFRVVSLSGPSLPRQKLSFQGKLLMVRRWLTDGNCLTIEIYRKRRELEIYHCPMAPTGVVGQILRYLQLGTPVLIAVSTAFCQHMG